MISPEETIDRLRRAFGGPAGHRTLHAKGHFYSGSFTATPEAARRCRAAHLDGDTHPVLVRWSNAGGNADLPDTTPDIRGMAVKLSGDDGAPFDLLGLFEGRGISERFTVETGEMPNRIRLYRRPILDYWAENDETLGDIITHVLIHEIGHHFGLSDEDMERIEASAEEAVDR